MTHLVAEVDVVASPVQTDAASDLTVGEGGTSVQRVARARVRELVTTDRLHGHVVVEKRTCNIKSVEISVKYTQYTHGHVVVKKQT